MNGALAFCARIPALAADQHAQNGLEALRHG